MKLKRILLILGLSFMLFSCATRGSGVKVQQPDAGQPAPAVEQPDAGQPAPAAEQPAAEQPAPAAEEKVPAETDPGTVKPETAETAVVRPTEEGAITVTREVFSRTFADIETLITELSRIIKAENYDAWIKFLTKDYIAKYSDPVELAELSTQPLLQKYNIKLRSLKDYFSYVVVQSRSNAKLDDLVFLSNDKVKAISVINGQRVILYLLENSNGSWKIGTMQN
ncbi:MAG: hypothetical protein E4H36_01110 [Spirochaetales bacterium]|nr:MAG: hypothetical protein E4H36_01110 [Spirochaetales bacterium]